MATWGRDWLEYDASNTLPRSRELQSDGLNSADHQQPGEGGTWLVDGGRAIHRVLTAALAGILSVFLAWRILLGLDETEAVADTAKTTTVDGRDVAREIDQLNVGGTEPVTHDNNATAAADLASQVSEASAHDGDSLPGSVTDSRVDMPSRNYAATAVGEGSVCNQSHVPPTDDGPDDAPEWTHHNFARRSTTSQDMLDNVAGMSAAEVVHDKDIPTFRRRPLICTDG